MCGIAALLCGGAKMEDHERRVASITEVLRRRGPDGTQSCRLPLQNLEFIASVLHIQGDKMCGQPCVDGEGNVLLWNGEVFGVEEPTWLDFSSLGGESDTLCVSRMLARLNGDPSRVAVALSSIQGPYAFIYFHLATRRLFWGRDPFGRRSLLLQRTSESSDIVTICSCSYSDLVPATSSTWEEVAVTGVFHMTVAESLGKVNALCEPWPSSRVKLRRLQGEKSQFSVFQQPLKPSEALLEVLRLAVSKRVARITSERARAGVLFSGGLDSVVLAILLHQSIADECLPIELINVTFVGGEIGQHSPDRLAAIAALSELENLFPSRKWVLVHVDVSTSEMTEYTQHIKNLIQPRNTSMDLNIAAAFWFASRGNGVLRENSQFGETIATYGALDKGGRPLLRLGGDGAAKGVGLAEWSDSELVSKSEGNQRCSPTCGRVRKRGCINECCSKCCYQRQKQSCGEVLAVPCRVHKPTVSAQKTVTEIAPTEPLIGLVAETVTDELYTCTCKVLLIGIGADEQMAGYGRHRTTFLRGAKEGGTGEALLEAEMTLDMARLWERNLGRDDRAISDNGREAWFPFLDENVVAFLQSQPLSSIADLTKPPGVGDKLILREAARALGLGKVPLLVKRAIQFGSNIAKQAATMSYGSNRKGKGTTTLL